jgi:hypothetical protein
MMQKTLSLYLLFINLPCFANDKTTLDFSIKVKNEIEKIFLEGQQRYEYDKDKNLVKIWKDKNISATDMQAYNIAHDLERKIKLSNELIGQKYIYTHFPEHISPMIGPKN